MKCKYCQAELESNSSVCPSCGKDNLKDDLKALKIVALSLVCVVMLVLLAGLVHYGVTGSFLPNLGSNSGNTDATGGTTPEDTTVTLITKDGEVTLEPEELADFMDDVVVTMGESTMTNTDLQLYYWMVAYNEEGLDPEKPLTEQIYDKETGKTWHEYCLETAVDGWREVTLMVQQAKKAGYELDAAANKYLEGIKSELESYVQMYQMYGYPVTNVDELIQMMYGPGSNYDSYYNYLYTSYYGGMYWSEMVDGLEATDQQIEDYFAKNEESLAKDYIISVTKDFGNLMDIRNIMVSVVTTKDEDGKTVQDWEATKAKAQEIYDKWVAAGKTEEAFIELVSQYSEDTGSKDSGGLYTDMYRGGMSEVDVRHILIFPEGATSNTVTSKEWPEEAWAYAENKAQELLDQWLAGDMTEESFAALANEHSDDNNGKVTNGGIYTDVYMGQMVKAFEAWCFDSSRKAGDTGIVKTEYGYHVMYFVRADNEADNWVCDENRQSGDAAILACDDGYQILYFVGSEPAWQRYSRYGVQAEMANEILDQLMKDTEYTFNADAAAVAVP